MHVFRYDHVWTGLAVFLQGCCSILALVSILWFCTKEAANDTCCNLHIVLRRRFVISCNEHRTDTKLPKKKTVLKTIPKVDNGPVEFKGLIDVQSLDSTIYVDLKYATADNFMGFQLYKTIKRPYLQPEVAQRVVKCQEFLSTIDSSLHLLIYDAARPVSVQKLMWEALDSLPPVLRGRYVSNPYHRSLHNMGAAIDVTLCHDDGVPLDMGADFDEFREIAYPRLEFRFLKTGELTKTQHENQSIN